LRLGQTEHPAAPVQVASVATPARPERLKRWAASKSDLVVVDEAHRILATSCCAFANRLPYSRLIGFLATPRRLDRPSLGRIFGEMVVVASVRELIDGGWLSPVRVFVPEVISDFSQRRLVTAAGTEEGRRWDQQRLTTLTGRDRIQARFMCGDVSEYTP
jgi:superfamily II DNA or RNA helicase